MADRELIIDDDYCRDMGTTFQWQGEKLDELLKEYITIMENVSNQALLSGNVADAMKVYVSYVKKMDQQIGNISDSLKEDIDKFLKEIDSEDQYLF